MSGSRNDILHSGSSNFGARGWAVVGYTAFLMFINGIVHTNGINVLLKLFHDSKGWETADLLSINSVGGIIGVLCTFGIGPMIAQFGCRRVTGLSLILTGVLLVWFGTVNSILSYTLCIICMYISTTAFGQMCAFNLNNNWFPRKKGIALGWATMGYPLCSIFAVPFITWLVGTFTFTQGFLYLGIAHGVAGVISLLFVRDYPEECGAFPDNDPHSAGQIKPVPTGKKPNGLTVGKLLRDRNMWSIAVSLGLIWMATIGTISQMVPRMMGIGFSQTEAVRVLQLASVYGIVFSWFFGWLDQKIGTRWAALLMCGCSMVSCTLLATTGTLVPTLVAVFFAGVPIGAVCNMIPSMIGTVYGREHFPYANGVIAPIASLFRVCNFAVLGFSLRISGGYALAYLLFGIFSAVAALLIFRTKYVYYQSDREES